MSRRHAKHVLESSIPHVSKAVIVVSDDYFATSLSVADSKALEANITLLNEALKKLRRWHRVAQSKEKSRVSTQPD